MVIHIIVRYLHRLNSYFDKILQASWLREYAASTKNGQKYEINEFNTNNWNIFRDIYSKGYLDCKEA